MFSFCLFLSISLFLSVLLLLIFYYEKRNCVLVSVNFKLRVLFIPQIIEQNAHQNHVFIIKHFNIIE